MNTTSTANGKPEEGRLNTDCFSSDIYVISFDSTSNRTVQWSGEYRAGFTLIYYRREGELEEVHIPGPSVEDLRFLVSLLADAACVILYVSYNYAFRFLSSCSGRLMLA